MDTSQNMLLTHAHWYATTSKTTTTRWRNYDANVDNIMARNQCFGIITEKYMFVIIKFKDHLRKYIAIVREGGAWSSCCGIFEFFNFSRIICWLNVSLEWTYCLIQKIITSSSCHMIKLFQEKSIYNKKNQLKLIIFQIF